MKRLLLSFALLSLCFTTQAQNTVELSLQPNYTDEVFYKISTDEATSFEASNWELAFLRTSDFAFATRVNDGIGIEVYQASSNSGDWETIDISNNETWTPLYNSDIDWGVGAFDQATATYGWGEYNADNHHVEGAVIFVLKYPDDRYKKFMIEDFFGGYTFKYADWNAETSSWEEDQTMTLSNEENPANYFNYVNLTTGEEVNAAPETTAWDLVFKKYTTDLGGGTMYTVTGVLHNPAVTVAKEITETPTDGSALTYAEEINTIGYDWKSFDGSAYVVEPNTYFYVKYEDGTIYRIHFTSFEGSSTGNLSFTTEQLTNLSTVNFNKENSFCIYPNPSASKQVNLLYENQNLQETPQVSIFNLNGAKVYQTTLQTNGFYNQALDLSKLSTGIYLVKFTSGTYSTTQKLILN